MTADKKIYVIHATRISFAPAKASFDKHWPQAKVCNLLDDSLASDRQADGEITDSMLRRFEMIGAYCAEAGADAILFTCSAFGSAIEHVKRLHDIPILTPNEALFDSVLDLGGPLALMTTFGPSIPALRDELSAMSAARGQSLQPEAVVVDGALDALLAGDQALHDRLVAEKAVALRGYSAIMFGQFSMAGAAELAQPRTQTPILTTPDCAVQKLMRLVLA